MVRVGPQTLSSESLIKKAIMTAKNKNRAPIGVKPLVPVGAKAKVRILQISPDMIFSRSNEMRSTTVGSTHCHAKMMTPRKVRYLKSPGKATQWSRSSMDVSQRMGIAMSRIALGPSNIAGITSCAALGAG